MDRIEETRIRWEAEKGRDEAGKELTKPNMFNDEGCQYKCLVVDTLKARVEELEQDKGRLSILGGEHHFKMADYRDALEEIASVPCICEPCYKDRGLIQPDCFYCHVGIIATDALKEGGENE